MTDDGDVRVEEGQRIGKVLTAGADYDEYETGLAARDLTDGEQSHKTPCV